MDKGWIIISVYDSGVNYSITIDGKTASRECLEEQIVPLTGKLKKTYNKHIIIRDIIKEACDFKFYNVLGNFNKHLALNIAVLFECKVIVCEDGNTKIVEY